MSGVLSAVAGNYLQRGAQSAQDDWDAPIEYNRPDIDALDALMNSLRGWPN
jgi:hypothetical protein